MKKASIDNQTQRSFNKFSWEQLIINGNLVISISVTNADDKTMATKTNKKKTVRYLSVKNRPLHAPNVRFSLYFRSDFTYGGETCTVDGETPFLGLPAFLSRLSDCYGRRNIFTVKTE